MWLVWLFKLADQWASWARAVERQLERVESATSAALTMHNQCNHASTTTTNIGRTTTANIGWTTITTTTTNISWTTTTTNTGWTTTTNIGWTTTNIGWTTATTTIRWTTIRWSLITININIIIIIIIIIIVIWTDCICVDWLTMRPVLVDRMLRPSKLARKHESAVKRGAA